MPKNKGADSEKRKEHRYWRVIVAYSDGEASGNRVLKECEKAETFAARQKKSPVVKETVIEPFVRQQYGGGRVFKHSDAKTKSKQQLCGRVSTHETTHRIRQFDLL